MSQQHRTSTFTEGRLFRLSIAALTAFSQSAVVVAQEDGGMIAAPAMDEGVLPPIENPEPTELPDPPTEPTVLDEEQPVDESTEASEGGQEGEVVEPAEPPAELIAATCIKRKDLIGQVSGTNFSDEVPLTTSVRDDMRLYAYRECNDPDGHLRQFTLIFADEQDENRTALSEIGPAPREGIDVCQGYRVPFPYVNYAGIFEDVGRVYGVKFIALNLPTDIGSSQGTPLVEYFTPNDLFTGFYGSYTDEYITSLGFLTWDPDCVPPEQPVEPTEPVPEEPTEPIEEEEPEETTEPTEPEDSESTETEEESLDEAGGGASISLIICLAVGGLVVIAAAIIVFCVCRKRRAARKGEEGHGLHTNNVAPVSDDLKISQISELKKDKKGKRGGSGAQEVVRQELNDTQDMVGEGGGAADHSHQARRLNPDNNSRRELLTQDSNERNVANNEEGV